MELGTATTGINVTRPTEASFIVSTALGHQFWSDWPASPTLAAAGGAAGQLPSSG
jgi:hypothetical protein